MVQWVLRTTVCLRVQTQYIRPSQAETALTALRSTAGNGPAFFTVESARNKVCIQVGTYMYCIYVRTYFKPPKNVAPSDTRCSPSTSSVIKRYNFTVSI